MNDGKGQHELSAKPLISRTRLLPRFTLLHSQSSFE